MYHQYTCVYKVYQKSIIMSEKDAISIIGCGQIGFRNCIMFASKGYNVVTYDTDKKKIEDINSGIAPVNGDPYLDKFNECKGMIRAYSDIGKCCENEYITVCVPTPLKNKIPDLSYLEDVTGKIAQNLRTDTVIIYESTVYPGVTKHLISILEESGLKIGYDFGVAHCPERLDPGNKEYNIENTPRVIGASDKKTLEKAKKLYESVMSAPVRALPNLETAEACKIAENTYRDVNIAYVNELANVFADTEVDVHELISAAGTKPYGFMVHRPGPGVGGDCIPISPYWLMRFANKHDKETPLIKNAREINEGMPKFVANRLANKMKEIDVDIDGSTVMVLGLTYKPNFADIKNPPAKDIVKYLKELRADVKVCDPLLDKKWIEKEYGIKPSDMNERADAGVLVMAHDIFDKESLDNLNAKLLFDACNKFNANDFRKIKYTSLR